MNLFDDGKKIAITVRPLVIIPCERLLAFGQLVTEGFYKETGLVDTPR